jgi:hypothetical protein
MDIKVIKMSKPDNYTEAINVAKEISSRQQTEPLLTALAGAWYQFASFTSTKHVREEVNKLLDALEVE